MTRGGAALVVVIAAACGRIDFDPLVPDGATAPRVCGVPETAPPTISVGGVAMTYDSFLNDPRLPVGGAMVTAREAESGALLDMGPADTDGYYLLAVPTGGVPRRVTLHYDSPAVFQPTTAYSDLGLYQDTIAPDVPLWSLGAGPMWTMDQMTFIYDAVAPPIVWTTSMATLNVAVRDCRGAIVEQVAVAVDPAPAALRYQDVDGSPGDLTGTVMPFAHVVAFDVPPGAVQITGTITGREVVPQTVTVTPGETTLAILRVLD